MGSHKGTDGWEYDHADTGFMFKRPKDSEGNNKHYRLKVTIAGKEQFIPVGDDQMQEFFKDWQLGIPGFVVEEPIGNLVMDPSLSSREVALISGALNAYYRAGRLNLDWNDDAPLHGLEYSNAEDDEDE